jgi:DeoR/GlpR family transcriptional regulator of sugar metabolism
MENSGLVRRVRGGAELTAEQHGTEQAEEELPFEYRKGIQLEKKTPDRQGGRGAVRGRRNGHH